MEKWSATLSGGRGVFIAGQLWEDSRWKGEENKRKKADCRGERDYEADVTDVERKIR